MGFKLISQDNKARAGTLILGSTIIQTPCFMPVATQGSIKGVETEYLTEIGYKLILSNAYHLYLRPGLDVLVNAGGIKAFMGWDGAILTDSGGFQLLSLPKLTKIDDSGVEFRSHIDGSTYFITPEDIVNFQVKIGSDFIMSLDECIGYPSTVFKTKDAMIRTLDWARRSRTAFCQLQGEDVKDKMLFGIVQGGHDEELRIDCADEITSIGFDGYAIGGIGVGEPLDVSHNIVNITTEHVPIDKPRYLMGLGKPEDLVEYIGMGLDMFDCVLPTRNARNGVAFTGAGLVRIRNSCYKQDKRPLDVDCGCRICAKYSRAYLRHLMLSGEMLGGIFLSLHNLFFYTKLLKDARDAIIGKRFNVWKQNLLTKLAEFQKEKVV